MGKAHAWFTRLYEQFYPRVLAYALHRTPPDQARDITDETFLIAWRRRGDMPDAPLPWLLATARNTISDQWRRTQWQDAIALELTRRAQAVRQPGADVTALERITVLTALAQLAEPDREVLMLTVWDGLTAREAGGGLFSGGLSGTPASGTSAPCRGTGPRRRPLPRGQRTHTVPLHDCARAV